MWTAREFVLDAGRVPAAQQLRVMTVAGRAGVRGDEV